MGSYESGKYATGLGYIDPTDAKAKDLRQMKDWFYNANYTGCSAIWVQGAVDKRFKIGDSALYSASYGQNYQQFQKFFFNLIRRHGNMITGFQRKNRKSTITVPNQQDTDPLADDYNKVIRWCEDRDSFQEYFSQSFEGGIDVGLNWLWMYPDYTYDPISGDLFTDSVAYNNVLWDFNFRKMDMTDSNGVWRRQWISKACAIAKLPGYESEIKKMKPGSLKDGRFPLQAELQNLQLSNLFVYDEFYYRTTRPATLIIDPYSGEAMEWEDRDGDPEGLKEMTLRQQPWLKEIKKDVPTVKMVLSIGDHIVYDGPNFLNIDEYPCVPHLCYHEPDILQYNGRYMGYIRNLRDAQFLYNMRKVIELQILQSQINAGWIYPVDAVVDPKCFRQSGGDAFLVPLKKGRLPNEIQRIEPSALPQSLMELSRSLSEDITKISGVNEELLGMADDDKSGILSMLRQSAGLVTLQTIFDKSDLTQRLYGKIRLQAIRKNFSEGKITNILGHKPDPRFFSDFSQKYGISVEEGNYSTTQRQMELQQYLHMKQLGIPIANKTILRAAFITNKKQAMQEMEEEGQQQMQMQQMQMQQQAQLDNSKITLEYAKSKLDLAKAQESYAKVEEIKSQAEHNNTKSELDMVKSMVELENMDLENIRSTHEIAEYIKAINTINSQKNLAYAAGE